MILQSLYRYYQILQEDPDLGIAEPGYTSVPVSHALNLSRDGELLNVIPLYVSVQAGNRAQERPRRMNVPEQVKRSVNVAANFMYDNAAYVLGISNKEAKDPDYAKKRFEAFRSLNLEILSQASGSVAHAVAAFLKSYDPQKAAENPIIARHLEELMNASNVIFQVEGEEALTDPEIRRAWEKYRLGQDAIEMQCLVTGEMAPIARLHPDIKGVRGAQQKGGTLVGFNLDAFTSYGREQGFNSPVSIGVASGYGVALNYLLSDRNLNRKIYLGDTTVVYWAESRDPRYANAFLSLINPELLEEQPTEEKASGRHNAEKKMGEVAKKVEGAKPIDLAALRQGLDESTRFYVLGLAPSAARLAVRFFLSEPFGVFAERIMQHYQDMSIVKEYPGQPIYLSPFRILAECVSPKVIRRKEELESTWSLLGGALLRSILGGTPYPEGLYAAILSRVRRDADETNAEGKRWSVKVSYPRTAFLKAYLLRKYRRQAENPFQEALQMSLDPNYTHPAYVLGRLFAVLEKAQGEAIGQNINATIKDRYFASACATPASVFPTLLRLSQHWTSKADYGYSMDRKIQDLLDLLQAKPFPARLSLDEQGVFVLGYYHQRAAFYTKGNGQDAAGLQSDVVVEAGRA